jgi:hypothetical protein
MIKYENYNGTKIPYYQIKTLIEYFDNENLIEIDFKFNNNE